MKKFLWHSLKGKIPLFVVVTVVLVTVALLSASSADFRISYENYYYFFDTSNSNSSTLGLLICFFLVLTFLPIFSMSYRYSLGKADFFKQAPCKNKTIRYIEHLSTLAIILIAYSLAFIVLVFVLFMKNFSYPEYFEVIYFNYGYFVPVYFLSILFAVLQYFISYLFVSRSNSVFNSIVTLVAGEYLLGGFAYVIFFIAYRFNGVEVSELMLMMNASPVLPIYLLYQGFNSPIVYGRDYLGYVFQEYQQPISVFLIYLSGIVFVGTAALGIIAFFIEKEPSGEYAGKPKTGKPYQDIIYHAGFFCLGCVFGFLLGSFSNIFMLFIYATIFIAYYYCIYGASRRNFKLNPVQISVMSGVIVLSILYNILIRHFTIYDY